MFMEAAEPFQLEFPQARQQLTRCGAIADDIVVHEEYTILQREPAAERAQTAEFGDDLVRRPIAVAPAKSRRDRAELAVQRTTPRRFHKMNRQVTLAVVEIPIGQWEVVQRGESVFVAVKPLQLLPFKIRQQPGPQPFRLAHHNAIAMVPRLVGQRRNVHAAHDHFDAAPAVVIGDLIGPRRDRRHGGNPHQIGLLLQIQRLHFLVENPDFPIGRGQGGHLQQPEHRQPEVEVLAHQAVLGDGGNEQQTFHDCGRTTV